jgi:hypothetical protein
VQLLIWLQDTAFARWVSVSPSLWAYPTILTAHTVGLAMLVGSAVVIDLVLLGAFRGLEVQPLERLFPIAWAGFWVNAVSGACLFVADAATKGTQPIFYLKMGFIAAGVAIMLRTRRSVFRSPQSHPSHPGLLAAASLGCWLGAITAGRLMAYVK